MDFICAALGAAAELGKRNLYLLHETFHSLYCFEIRYKLIILGGITL